MAMVPKVSMMSKMSVMFLSVPKVSLMPKVLWSRKNISSSSFELSNLNDSNLNPWAP